MPTTVNRNGRASGVCPDLVINDHTWHASPLQDDGIDDWQRDTTLLCSRRWLPRYPFDFCPRDGASPQKLRLWLSWAACSRRGSELADRAFAPGSTVHSPHLWRDAGSITPITAVRTPPASRTARQSRDRQDGEGWGTIREPPTEVIPGVPGTHGGLAIPKKFP